MKYKAVCFDVDGTLYPPREMHKRLFKIWVLHPVFVLRYIKMRKVLRKRQDDFEDSMTLRQREASILGCSEEKLNKCFYNPLKREYEKIEPFDGIRETFLWLKENEIKIGVFSDFPLFDKLFLLGISDLVDVGLCSDDVGFLKPSVHPFENLLYKLEVEPSQMLYVGDEPKKDMSGAAEAGVDSYLVGDWKSFDRYIKEL